MSSAACGLLILPQVRDPLHPFDIKSPDEILWLMSVVICDWLENRKAGRSVPDSLFSKSSKELVMVNCSLSTLNC